MEDLSQPDEGVAVDGAAVTAISWNCGSLPTYQARKIVRASKIQTIHGTTLWLSNSGGPFKVDWEFIEVFKPRAGDYFVEFEKGFQGCIAPLEFESLYVRVKEAE